ncbi:DUF4138 domain-containing protein [Formosa sp. 3Alg 14/1]|uniref:DUF4138 domain-containing protein n=1 Tax=Formosa sp. 3Alg 14/1 TaxID=3382190 RepID=UPI0039BE56F8
MIRFYIFSISLLCLSKALAQPKPIIDTLYANNHQAMALFFPDPIRQAITGSDNFVFSYNREQKQHFGLLQGKQSQDSNLLIISDSGLVYSYIIAHKPQLKEFNRFVGTSEAIGYERPRPISPKLNTTTEKNATKTANYTAQFCNYLITKSKNNSIRKTKKHDITLELKNIVYNQNKLYAILKIINNSSLDYDINYLNTTVVTRKKGKNKSMQSLFVAPNFVFNMPTRVLKKRSQTVVYVLPKFSISNDRVVHFTLNESAGERDLRLKVPHRVVNRPK